jgi:hypothetical protein
MYLHTTYVFVYISFWSVWPVYVYIYIYIYTQGAMNYCLRRFEPVTTIHIGGQVCTGVRTCVYLRVCVCMYIYIYAYMCTCVWHKNACMHACIHVCMHVCMYACTYVYMHACMSVCVRHAIGGHTHTHIYISIHTQTYTYAHTRNENTYTHTQTCIYMHTCTKPKLWLNLQSKNNIQWR